MPKKQYKVKIIVVDQSRDDDKGDAVIEYEVDNKLHPYYGLYHARGFVRQIIRDDTLTFINNVAPVEF